MPIPPQKWHFRQSIEYSLTFDRAVLDVASRFRETFLFNIYRMGTQLDRPRKPRQLDDLTRSGSGAARPLRQREPARRGRASRARGGHEPIPPKYFDVLRDPAVRDARGYVVPSDQPDFLTATKFVNALLKAGIVVHRATASFQAAGRTYPAGSYVVKTAQSFRPHIRDMFEPQDHPDDIPYPGGPPKPPYDATGWTLAYQMGVAFDRVFDAFDGPFEKPCPA